MIGEPNVLRHLASRTAAFGVVMSMKAGEVRRRPEGQRRRGERSRLPGVVLRRDHVGSHLRGHGINGHSRGSPWEGVVGSIVDDRFAVLHGLAVAR